MRRLRTFLSDGVLWLAGGVLQVLALYSILTACSIGEDHGVYYHGPYHLPVWGLNLGILIGGLGFSATSWRLFHGRPATRLAFLTMMLWLIIGLAAYHVSDLERMGYLGAIVFFALFLAEVIAPSAEATMAPT
jgi:hypothetical protein